MLLGPSSRSDSSTVAFRIRTRSGTTRHSAMILLSLAWVSPPCSTHRLRSPRDLV